MVVLRLQPARDRWCGTCEPYQGVLWDIGSMNELTDLFPAGSNVAVDANGSGTPVTYTGITFH